MDLIDNLQTSKRTFFKHRFGYANIDTNHIYFTESGNWKETESLLERNEKPTNSNPLKIRIKRLFSVISPLIIISWINYDTIDEINFYSWGFYTYPIILGLIVLISFALSRILRDYSLVYKLPINKITNIKREQNKATIYYTDYNGKKAKHTLLKLSEYVKNSIDQITQAQKINFHERANN